MRVITTPTLARTVASSIESASSIKSCVYIVNTNIVLSEQVIVKGYCYIEENTVIPEDSTVTIVPTFSRVRGYPGKM